MKNSCNNQNSVYICNTKSKQIKYNMKGMIKMIPNCVKYGRADFREMLGHMDIQAIYNEGWNDCMETYQYDAKRTARMEEDRRIYLFDTLFKAMNEIVFSDKAVEEIFVDINKSISSCE